MSDFLVHRCRNLNYKPCSVQSIAVRYDNDRPLVALAREDSSIEIWTETDHVWLLLQTLPGEKDRSIQSLIWVDERLFSTHFCQSPQGTQSKITEYDLNTNLAKGSVVGYGDAIWCLAACESLQQIAAGCEDGSVRFYSTNPHLSYIKRYETQQPVRILSIAWHASGNVLVTGSYDVIEIWDTRKDRTTRRISMEREIKQKETIVWSLVILNDYTIVSGDSYGRVSMWNGKNGTLLYNFRAHKEQVLSLCTNDEQSTIFASGIDPRIIQFRHLPDGRWIKSEVLHSHTHDVRSVVFCRDRIFSGGVDTKLIVFSLNNKAGSQLQRMLPFPSKPLASSSLSRDLVLFQYSSHLELMKLAKSVENTNTTDRDVTIEEKEQFLLRIDTPKSDLGQIVKSEISACGNWIAYSTGKKFRLYYHEYDEKNITSKLNRISNQSFEPCTSFTFSTDGKVLLMTSSKHDITSFLLDADEQHAKLLNCYKAKDNCVKHLIEISENNKFFAVANLRGEVNIHTLIDLAPYCSLPQMGYKPATAMSFDPSNSNLIVAYSDLKICEFDLLAQSYTKWSREDHQLATVLHSTIPKKRSNVAVITKILHGNNDNEDKMMFVSHDGIYTIERTKSRRKHVETTSRFCKQFWPILHANYDQEKLLIVEQPLDRLLDELPSSLYQKKFAT